MEVLHNCHTKTIKPPEYYAILLHNFKMFKAHVKVYNINFGLSVT